MGTSGLVYLGEFTGDHMEEVMFKPRPKKEKKKKKMSL